MPEQVPCHMDPQVQGGSIAFSDAMIPVRINHIIELFAELYKPVNQSFRNLYVGISLSATMDDQ